MSLLYAIEFVCVCEFKNPSISQVLVSESTETQTTMSYIINLSYLPRRRLLFDQLPLPFPPPPFL